MRAPNDAWNMWFQDHIDPMFDRLIQNMVLFDEDVVYRGVPRRTIAMIARSIHERGDPTSVFSAEIASQ